jgi:hypothetical protein
MILRSITAKSRAIEEGSDNMERTNINIGENIQNEAIGGISVPE